MKPFNVFARPPAPPGFAKERVLPERQTDPVSRLLFSWVTPFLDVGYSRPLEKDDLWQLPEQFHASNITHVLEENFYARCPPESRPKLFAVSASVSSDTDCETGTIETQHRVKFWFRRNSDPKQDSSLVKALNQTFFFRIWFDGVLKLASDTLYTTSPLITKILLSWLIDTYMYYELPEDVRASGTVSQPHGIGCGIGLGFALFCMQQTASLLNNHHLQLAQTNGLYIRTVLVSSVFRKALRLSGRARLEHTTGSITTLISNDSSRFDRFFTVGHQVWTAPIQISIGIGLLIGNLGSSALVGLGVLLFCILIQLAILAPMFMHARNAITLTDQRVRGITEILGGIRLLKFYSWEDFYYNQISDLRKKEIWELRMLSTWRCGISVVVNSAPIIAAVLTFITYALTGHDLNAATIFTCLQLFNIIRLPLIFFPFTLGMMAEVLVSLGRIGKFLQAEELGEAYPVDPTNTNAVVLNGDFTWEEQVKDDNAGKDKGPHRKFGGKGGAKRVNKPKKQSNSKKGEKEEESSEERKEHVEPPFGLNHLHLEVAKGHFVAIVGKVGCGSILQAIIGEMRKTAGEVLLGGTVAYVPQTAWIKNATLKDNILFGQPVDESRFRQVVRACSLEHDLEVLPQGEQTEIGEKGINLSGGQKTRVSLARAAYSPADIILLDDPLSSVDAYVGNAILENCILSGPLASRTRIMTTHALHVLNRTDYIYVTDNGAIVEQGSYADLMLNSTLFSHMMTDYGQGARTNAQGKKQDGDTVGKVRKSDDEKVSLMQEEERETGAVAWKTYAGFLRNAGGIFWGPLIISLLILMQGSQVANTLVLGFWTSDSIDGFSQGQYMAVYAGLGVAQAVFSFLVSFAIAMMVLTACYGLFRTALAGVLRSPVSFFDTTPIGRILARLSKDQDTLDKESVMTLTLVSINFSSIIGTVALVFYVFPYLGILFVPLGILYFIASSFYRRTSVETKRLDSLMRSALYASFSESLTGLATLRAYHDAAPRAIRSAEHGLDMENRAYYMTLSLQRWLSVRLDFFSNVLLLGICLFGAGFRKDVDPSKMGVVLTYAMSITQAFSDMVTQFALNEQNMNAAERLLVYTNLPAEGEATKRTDPPSSWPEKGAIKFSDVDLRYRPELPLVLNKISFKVSGGEKVGIVGRTGAGKSSLLQALFRIVDIDHGTICIDGVDTQDVGLKTLRGRLALVPQDSTLFKGSLRDNLDPQRSRTDADLVSALQRAWLLPREGKDPAAEAKFSLDSTVSDEGTNFSVGERQLLSLCRVLVKNSRIIILDEATSSVDVATDGKLQQTIQTEFATSTVLCIAHRLNTIAYYDRIMVLDAGKVAEMDTVLNLYDKRDSIFRSLCNEANLGGDDIIRIRERHTALVSKSA